MAGTTTGNWWDYSRWTKNMARNARITEPVDYEAWVYRIMVVNFCNPVGNSGTRPWLAPALRRLAQGGIAGDDYDFNPITEPMCAVVKAVEVIGRDFKKIPITTMEQFIMDIILSLVEPRKLGTSLTFGGVGGSVITTP